MLCYRVVVLETQYAKAPLLPEPEYPVMKSGGFQLPGLLLSELLCLSVCERTVQVTFAGKCSTFFSCSTITKITSPKQPQVVPCLLMEVVGHSQKPVLCYNFWNILLVASLAYLSNWHLAASKWLADRACTVLRQRHSRAGHGHSDCESSRTKGFHYVKSTWLDSQWKFKHCCDIEKSLSTATTLKLTAAGFTFVNISRSLPTMCWCFEATKLHAITWLSLLLPCTTNSCAWNLLILYVASSCRASGNNWKMVNKWYILEFQPC